MSGKGITDKGSTKTSQWFGYKYRVNPETSKLLQEAVFRDGGNWYNHQGSFAIHTEKLFIVVHHNGELTYCDDNNYFRQVPLSEKEPPNVQPVLVSQGDDSQFKLGYWYRGLVNSMCFTKGKYYQYIASANHGAFLGIKDNFDNLTYRNISGFDVNSGCLYNPTVDVTTDTTKALQDKKYDIKCPTAFYNTYKELECQLFPDTKYNFNQQEETTMSTNNQRKTVTVNLIDRDSALDEKFALVATFGEFTTSKSSEALIRSIIIDPKNKVAELIAQHNEERVKQTNKGIMERTGNKVTLEAVEESDLYWEIR